MSNSQKTREFKGISYIDFINDFTVLDIETTGLSSDWNEILEISALKVRNGEIVDQFNSLVNEFEKEIYIDPFIQELTGITPNMIEQAPRIEKVLPEFVSFAGDDVILGQNISFDINFLYDRLLSYMDYKFSNNCIDTMRISRKLFKEESHHRLSDIAKRYSINTNGAHRALKDCEITLEVYKCLTNDVKNKYESFDQFIKLFKNKKSSSKSLARDIKVELYNFDEDNPLYGKHVCFTGKLERMVRKDAWQIVANAGGFPDDNVTKETNLLVLGDQDYNRSIKDGKSSKQKKAEKNKEKGFDIEILPETTFYEMIDEYLKI